jgi:hypothetical protein
MRHLLAWAAGAIIAGIVIGCGPAKELPDDIPRSTDNGRGEGDDRESVPEKSDPAALEIVERAIKAHTQNNPTLLEKGKISRLTADGTIKIPVGEESQMQLVSGQRTFLARWPDEIKYTVAFKPPHSGTRVLILKSPFTWTGLNGIQDPNLKPRSVEEDMRADGYGLHWLVLLFPLKVETTIVFDGRKGLGVGTPPADVVRVSIPGRPIYRLHVNPTSGLVVQIDYEHTYQLGHAHMEWILSDHKPFDGWLLPTDLKLGRTTDRPRFRDVVEDWKAERWEFPDKLDDNAFNVPK